MASDELSTTYYPSCVVNLLIRFDEVMAEQWAKGDFIRGALADQDLVNALATPLSLVPTTEPGTVYISRMPKTASIELPGVRKPGTFNLTFNYADLPIDPRLVRSVGIEIYMDTVRADKFAQGIMQTAPSVSGRMSTIEPAARISAVNPSTKNLVLKGLVDSWHVNHTASGSTATLEGRDLTGMFLDTPLTPAMVEQIKLDQQIHRVIADLVGTIGGWSKLLKVDAAPADQWPKGEIPYLANEPRINLATVQAAEAITRAQNGRSPRSRRSAQGGTRSRRSTGADPDKMSFWDLVTRYCFLVGAIPVCRVVTSGTSSVVTLMILPQWGLFDYFSTPDAQGRAPPVFDKNHLRPSVGNVRRLMYGRNVEEMSFERKYQGITARAVEVVSYNPSSNARGQERMISVTSKLPKSYAQRQGVSPSPVSNPAGSARSTVSPSGLTSYDAVMRITVKGVTDKDQLQNLADGLYEEIMRGETGGNIRTKSLASFGGTNEDPDLLYIRPSDPIQIAVDIRELAARQPNVETPLNVSSRPYQEVLNSVLAATGNISLARAVALSSNSAAFQKQNYFRVNAVRFDWDSRSGISIALDFHNYIMARNAIQDTPVGTPSQASIAAASTTVGAPKVRK